MKAFQNKIKTLPAGKEQNPVKFDCEYIDPKNQDLILEPMRDYVEKTKFANLINAMDPIQEIVDKSEPTMEDRKNISEYSRNVQSAMAALTWVKSWPNQFIRITMQEHFSMIHTELGQSNHMTVKL
jgi:hypothetical protein